jgi:hypothetical protein
MKSIRLRTCLLAAASCALAAIALAAARDGQAASEPIAGMWTAERSVWKVKGQGTATIVNVSMRRRGGGRGSWQSSFAVLLDDLRGLSSQDVSAATADVRFELARDAGTLRFEGRFLDGAGAGHFTFVPSDDFASAVRERGWGSLDAEKLFALAVHDVGRSFLRELSALGYERLTFDQAVSMRIHGASPEFVRELRPLGYTGLTVDQLLSFRIHGVSPEFIREFKGLGYDRVSVDQLVSMRIHGVTPEFVKRVNARAPAPATVDHLVSMRIHGREP